MIVSFRQNFNQTFQNEKKMFNLDNISQRYCSLNLGKNIKLWRDFFLLFLLVLVFFIFFKMWLFKLGLSCRLSYFEHKLIHEPLILDKTWYELLVFDVLTFYIIWILLEYLYMPMNKYTNLTKTNNCVIINIQCIVTMVYWTPIQSHHILWHGKSPLSRVVNTAIMFGKYAYWRHLPHDICYSQRLIQSPLIFTVVRCRFACPLSAIHNKTTWGGGLWFCWLWGKPPNQ